MIKKIVFVLLIFMAFAVSAKAELCKDYMIWDGSEPVREYGIDSTGNWWAMTAPFTDFYRLVINGKQTKEYNKLFPPVFSQDGNRWASFGLINGSWHLVTDDQEQDLKATDIGNIGFSNDSRTVVYSYFVGNIEYIKLNGKTVEVIGKNGTFFTNFNGMMYAFVGMRGSKKVLNINGRETTTYDDIIPIGFWQDNGFIYAALNGEDWQFYKNQKEISDNFTAVKDVAINHTGTVAAALVQLPSGFQTGITFSDEYYEPLFGRNYDFVSYLTIHPELPLISYLAQSGLSKVIVMNTAEYSTYDNTGYPLFSYDGDDLLFSACDFDCFININGKRFTLKSNISPQTPFALKPGSNTIAYATGATMIVMFLESQKMHAGMMVDRIINPIYNRRTNRYETIGLINQRLYLMTCTID